VRTQPKSTKRISWGRAMGGREREREREVQGGLGVSGQAEQIKKTSVADDEKFVSR
jgi:hypothetical protein